MALYGKGLDLTEALKAYVQQRLNKLDRFFPGEKVSAQVALSVQHERQIVEVTVSCDGHLLRAQEAAPSMYAAVDLVLEKLERQVHKYKTRLVRKPRQEAAARAERGGEVLAPAAEDLEAQVVRRKQFLLKPTTLEDAILQMELLDHDFFVFRDGSTGRVQVLYRRRGGGYGLISEQ